METLNQALSSLVRFGVSDQLIQDLQVIEETSDMDGKPLYDHVAIYEMRCAILCRNYAKTLWEYSHYIAVIEHESDYGVIDFFWGQNVVTHARFKHWLEDAMQGSECLKKDNSVIKAVIGNREFILNPKRINLMAAWTAFAVMVEPNLLTQLASFKRSLNEKEIDTFAKQLKSKFDAYLEPHLQALHQQRQGRVLLSWLQAQAGHQNHKTLLQDEAVLQFWQQNAETEEGDFKRFTTVADCTYRLHKAVELGNDQRDVESARSYHQDQSGEDAAWLLDEVSQVEADGWLFEHLMADEPTQAVTSLGQSPLDQIKFLTNKDAEFCSKLELAGAAITTLPLTYIRAQVFGLQQARMTEDLRATKGSNLAKLIAFDDFSGFNVWHETLTEQVGKIAQTRLAVVYILLQHEHPTAFARLIEKLTAEQKNALQQAAANQPNTMIGNQLLVQLKSIAPLAIKPLEKAYSKVNRTGFKTIPESDQVNEYLKGDEHLNTLERLLTLYSEKLAQLVESSGNLDGIEKNDTHTFSQVFKRLYGEIGVEA